MKKFTFLLSTLLLVSITAFAQVQIGLTGAVQLTNQKASVGGFTISGSNKIGFQAGLVIKAPITDNFSIRPQVLYSVKGSKFGDLGLGSGFSGDFSTTINYVEVPVQLAYGFEAGPGQFVLGAGPYVAYALNGKNTSTFMGATGDDPIDFGSGEDQTKRLDYGLRLSAGYELSSGLMLSAYYSPGLANLSNSTASTAKNTAFGLSLGFLFGGK